MATQRIKTGAVQVDGIVELNRAVKALGDDFKGEMRKVNKSVADFVASDSKGAAFSLGGVAAHVAPSIKASAGALSAGVGLGGPAYPMAGGAEFGSNGFKQFKPWTGNGSTAGYFVYPTIRENSERIVTTYGEGADQLIKKAGFS